MQSASLCSSTMNNSFAVYQKELTLLLIQASPTNRLLLFVTSAWDLLDLVKFFPPYIQVPTQPSGILAPLD